MQGIDYQKLAMRTNDGNHSIRLQNALDENRFLRDVPELLNGCLGLAGECGEFLDMVKKWIYHEKPLDEEHLQKELGDVLWYAAMICKAMKWDLDVVMAKNIAKLKARYPEGFDTDLSNHRKEGDL